MEEWYCLMQGRQVGPVTRQQLVQWLREGRLTGTDYVWREGMDEWAQVGRLPAFRQWLPPAMPPPPDAAPGPGADWPPGHGPAGDEEWGGEGAPGYGRPRPGRRVESHRGGVILTLGIISLVTLVVFCCAAFIFGIPAWVMADRDLRMMRNGAMDRGGEQLTMAGRICGIIGTVVSLLFVAVLIIGTCAGAQPHAYWYWTIP